MSKMTRWLGLLRVGCCTALLVRTTHSFPSPKTHLTVWLGSTLTQLSTLALSAVIFSSILIITDACRWHVYVSSVWSGSPDEARGLITRSLFGKLLPFHPIVSKVPFSCNVLFLIRPRQPAQPQVTHTYTHSHKNTCFARWPLCPHESPFGMEPMGSQTSACELLAAKAREEFLVFCLHVQIATSIIVKYAEYVFVRTRGRSPLKHK